MALRKIARPRLTVRIELRSETQRSPAWCALWELLLAPARDHPTDWATNEALEVEAPRPLRQD